MRITCICDKLVHTCRASWKPKGKIKDQRRGRLRGRTPDSPLPRANSAVRGCGRRPLPRGDRGLEEQLLNPKQAEEARREAGSRGGPGPEEPASRATVPWAVTGAGRPCGAPADLQGQHGACAAARPDPSASEQGGREDSEPSPQARAALLEPLPPAPLASTPPSSRRDRPAQRARARTSYGEQEGGWCAGVRQARELGGRRCREGGARRPGPSTGWAGLYPAAPAPPQGYRAAFPAASPKPISAVNERSKKSHRGICTRTRPPRRPGPRTPLGPLVSHQAAQTTRHRQPAHTEAASGAGYFPKTERQLFCLIHINTKSNNMKGQDSQMKEQEKSLGKKKKKTPKETDK